MKAHLWPRLVFALALLSEGCSTTRQFAGGLSVASGVMALSGAVYVTYAGTEAPPQASAAPYVLGAGAGALTSATFFALAAYLLGSDERRQGGESGAPAGEPQQGAAAESAPRRCFDAQGRAFVINSNETCAQRGLRYTPPRQ
jgi:hypothetical protein